MALTIAQLFTRTTKEEIKAQLLVIAEAAGLPVTSWVFGDVSERWSEIIPRVLDQFLSVIIAEAVRGFFLDFSTDPGDHGDTSPDQTPRAGWLSALGEGRFGVTRRGQTFATGDITVTNVSGSPVVLRPGDLTVQRSVLAADGGAPTYTTTADASVYTGFGGTLTLANLASASLPIAADTIGEYCNANSGEITILQTGTFGTLTVTNPNPALASEREDVTLYRDRVRFSTARVATGGPSALYIYTATTALDGTPLQRHDGSGPVGITRVFVDDAFQVAGEVNVYLADGDGGSDAIDVASANANITGIPLGVIVDPIGVVPGVVAYATVAAAEISINVIGNCKIKAGPEVTAATVRAAIVTALTRYFSTFPIGGLDPGAGAGAGLMYRNDLECVVRDSFPGVYAPNVVLPVTSSVAIPFGTVATLDSVAADWTVTIT